MNIKQENIELGIGFLQNETQLYIYSHSTK